MNIKTSVLILSYVFTLFSCDNQQDNNTNHLLHEVKDTINVADLRSEFRQRLYSSGIGVELEFFDKNHQRISRLNKRDTFFVRVDYISDTFVDLAKNHSTELYHAKGDFKFLGKDARNNYKMVIGTKSDTIEFDVFLKSNKYIFNDYFLENGEIKYHLVEKIGLCRLKELPR